MTMISYINPYGNEFFLDYTVKKEYKSGLGASIRICNNDPHRKWELQITKRKNLRILIDDMAVVPVNGTSDILSLDGRTVNIKNINKDFILVDGPFVGTTYYIKHVLTNKYVGVDNIIAPTTIMLVSEESRIFWKLHAIQGSSGS